MINIEAYKNLNIASEAFIQAMLKQKLLYITNKQVDETAMLYWQKYWATHSLVELNTDTKKLSFWINIYNGLTIFFIIQLQLKQHMKEDLHFFDGYFIMFNEYELSLDAIEHGILRKNKDAHFQKDADWLSLQVNEFNNNIHFALNCGGLSCPTIHVYNEVNLQQQLQNVTTQFIDDNFLVDSVEKTITCNAIFSWYKADFENEYLNNIAYKNYTVNLLNYNWYF